MAETKAPQATAPVAEEKPAKAPKVPLQETFDNEAALKAEVDKREKGPRRAFKVTSPDGKTTHWVAANNEGRAAGVAFMKLGGKVEEIGKPAKSKALDTDTLVSALATLSPDDRKKVMDQLGALAKKG